MGEVYRARDLKLKREVAIKILPEEFSRDDDRVSRFQREAEVLASLNHPNIAAIYDLQEADNSRFLVLELVEGETLAGRIARGPVPINETLHIAKGICEGFEAAHEKGVVHRDLKPANIKVTSEGRVKILDFGLAKMFAPNDVAAGLPNSSTLLSISAPGVILGTAAYMSPEQARGQSVDAQSDIWAFGCVLYEMLTGRVAFGGNTASDQIAAILEREPDWSALPPLLPAYVRRVLSRCLEKDVRRRWRDIGDVRLQLDTPSIRRRVGWKAIATGTAALVAAVTAAYVYSSRPRAFSERDWVVIADFANRTGNAMFDDTLKEVLDVELRQTPFLSVLSDQRVEGTLRLMGRARGEKLTPDVARDLCQRTGSKAMIAGSISQLGRSYVISLDATNCRTGDTIDKRQVQAGSQEQVLTALASVAGQLRRGLGESLASIEKYDAPIQNATTRSLDALKSYSLGMVTRRRQGNAPAIPFFRKAIDQDPGFALAHAGLSTVLNNLGETQPAIDEIRKAYELKDRVSEPERLYIVARYNTIVEDSLVKAIDTYRVWIQTYPNDYVPHANAGQLYLLRREYENAVDESQTAIRLAPDEQLPYGLLANSYILLGKLDEAHKTMDTAIAHGMDSTGIRNLLYEIASLKKDDADMARQLEAARRFPDSFLMLTAQAGVALFRGQLAWAREVTAHYESESIAKTGLKASAANLWGEVAQVSALAGDNVAARTERQKSLALDRSINTLLTGAETLAIEGDAAGARKMLDDARRSFPSGVGPEFERIFQTIAAMIRIHGGDKRAIDVIPTLQDDADIDGRFFIGWANLVAGNADVAATRFKEIIDFPRPTTSTRSALAPLFYGRALAKFGRQEEARKAYEQFFDKWKTADARLPIVVAAREEYGKLQK
jgi:tetratricopeptide (TPR) repeat protein